MGAYDYGKFTVSMDEVLAKIGIPIPAGKVKFNISCPVCSKNKREVKLNIDLAGGVFRCAKCGAGGGPLNLYGLFKTGSENLTKDECREYTKEIKGVKSFKQSPQFKRREPIVMERIDLDTADLNKRNDAYSYLMSGLGLTIRDYNNLIQRGLTREDIIFNGYRSAPQHTSGAKIAEIIRSKGCPLDGVPGFYTDKKGRWTFVKQSEGFLIPVRSIEGKIERTKGLIEGLQLRTYNPDESKYKWLSSRDFLNGAGALTWPHFVGYPEEEVLLTEGPLKADIIYKFTGKPVIGIPGVNAISQLEHLLNTLKKYKVKSIKIAFDMDMYINPFVKEALKTLSKLLKEKGFETKALKWDDQYKGYDDFLLAKYLEFGGKLDEVIKGNPNKFVDLTSNKE